MIGQSLSRYVIESELGAGGMGVVFKGRDTVLQRSVAIKILPPDKVADEERKRRFVQEAKAASALNHPNIITIFDIGSDAGRDFIVMEHLAGSTLDRLIPANGLPRAKALSYAIAIADALSAAHRAGIIHRDLKPSNVMISDAGTVKVLDFGVAKLLDASDAGSEATRSVVATEEGITVGTPAYMSPEQAERRPLDARSDIFSFGSVLYEMVTGRKAFDGSSSLSVLAKILNDEPVPPGRLTSTLPPELEQIILRCLRKDPERRFQTMADLKVMLEDLAASAVNTSSAVPAVSAPGRRWQSAAAAFAALVLGAAIYFEWPRQTSRDDDEPLAAAPLAGLPGQVRFPAISGDGDRVAFTWTGASGDNTDIYVQQIGAGAPLRLTTDPAVDTGPAWSPDGKAIAFLRRIGNTNTHEVRIVPPLGGAERKIAEVRSTQPQYRPRTLTWCPDSSCVIVADGQSDGKADALFAINMEGERRQLTFPPTGAMLDTDPAVSPDGRSLVFRRDLTPFTGEMYRLPIGKDMAPAGELARLTDIKISASRPAWTPDSRSVVFSAKGGLWRVDAFNPKPPARLPFVGLDGSQPAISNPGSQARSRLVYVRVFTDSNIWRIDAANSGAAPYSPPRRVIASARADHFPVLSPDGKRLAFFSSRSGEFELWVSDPDGANAVQLTTLKSLPGFPRWSPDSRTITFHSDPEGRPDVLTISADGGRFRVATTGSGGGGYPSFSRDGRFIYFNGPDSQMQFHLWKIPADGGSAIKVADTPGGVPVESYDGADLYYVDPSVGLGTLFRQPVTGGAPTKVLEGVINAAFDLSEAGVYYIGPAPVATGNARLDSSGDSQLEYYSFATGKTQTIAGNLGPAALGLSTSRDGRTIFVARVDASVDELLLVDNFR